MGPLLVWHRGDLRLHDHPALLEALARGPVVGLVVLDPNNLKTTPRRRAWFLENVRALREAYRARGGALWVLEGLPWEKVPEAARRLKAKAVYALTSHTPYGRYRDGRVREALPVPLHLLPAPHLLPPTSPGPTGFTPPLAASTGGPPRPFPLPRPCPRGQRRGKSPGKTRGFPSPSRGRRRPSRGFGPSSRPSSPATPRSGTGWTERGARGSPPTSP